MTTREKLHLYISRCFAYGKPDAKASRRINSTATSTPWFNFSRGYSVKERVRDQMGKMSHEEYVELQRRRVAQLASRALSGELDVLDAARQIGRLRHALDFQDDDPDLAVFDLIESEIETLPVGEEAKNWHPQALARKAKDLERARAWVWQTARAELENLRRRLGAV